MDDTTLVGEPAADNVNLIDRFRRIPAANVGDAMERLGAMTGIHSIWPNARLVGPAFTVWTRAGDNSGIHRALELAEAGDVIVVNGEGDLSRALIGEMIGAKAAQCGVEGFVIDGAARDASGLAKLGMPAFARAVTPAGPYKNGPYRIGAIIAVGGVAISPGDLIIGDDDGIVVVPKDMATEVIIDAEAIFAKEESKRALLFPSNT
jgi:regulator of RNase E activity RraA